jgi:hypothetical protein
MVGGVFLLMFKELRVKILVFKRKGFAMYRWAWLYFAITLKNEWYTSQFSFPFTVLFRATVEKTNCVWI